LNLNLKQFTLFLFLSGISLAQNWYPLEVGNKWQFLYSADSRHFGQWADLKTITVLKDTTINKQKYYKLSDHPDDWVRYTAETRKLYVYWNDSDYVHMDFNLNNNDIFKQLSYFPNHFLNPNIEFQTYDIFGDNSVLRGYHFFWGDQSLRIYFKENLGYCLQTIFDEGPLKALKEYELIQAIIKIDSNTAYYSYNNYPVIKFTPINSVSDSILDLQFNVEHKYSLFRTGIYLSWSFNYIDTVYLEAYYQKGDSVIRLHEIGAVNTVYTDEYKFRINLNTELLKHGYKYYYKIIAKDKGIIPGSSSSPDTNYYQITYSEETGVKEWTGNIPRYVLFQNYPNPFNPETDIRFTLPKSGKVVLGVYGILGNHIKTLVDENKNAGNHQVSFNVSGLASGIYFYRLRTNDFSAIKKMVLIE